MDAVIHALRIEHAEMVHAFRDVRKDADEFRF